jgi:Ca2+-binding RTX toxin-like protein
MFSFLSNLFTSKTTQPATKKSISLGVETLEDRMVPSTYTLNQGVLTINITEPNRAIHMEQSNGVVWVQGNSFGWYTSAVQKIVVWGGPTNCTIDLSGVQSIAAEIHGGNGNNLIYGSRASDVIFGGTGSNTIFGEGSSEILYGTGSYNRLIAGPGFSKLYAETGLNFMDGGETRGGHAQYFTSNGTLDYVAEAFAPGNVYSPEHIRQGYTCNTCNFLAVLEGMAQSGVKFDSYIHFAGLNQSGQGLYDVYLSNGSRWFTERVVFDGQTSWTDNLPTVNQASWAIIMERAWQQYHGNVGGSEYAALVALGRSPTVYNSFASLNYFNLISQRLSQGYTVVAGTNTAVTLNDLVTTHGYAILATGYNTNGVPCVLLRNPWGFNQITGQPQHYNADMWITWNDFVQNFVGLTIG